MLIFNFAVGPLSTNCYLIACKATLQAAVIDPGFGAGKLVLAKASEQGISIEKILLTHSHWDHFIDASMLRERVGAQIYIHELDAENLEEPGADGLPMMIPVRAAPADKLFKNNDVIQVGELAIQVIHTPGHSPGGVGFYLPKEGVLFSGDTLFQGTFGSLSLPTAEPEKMVDSLKRLAKLPSETRIFPGHGGDTTIGREKWLNEIDEFL